MIGFKVAALWTFGKLLAVFVFVATSLGSCAAVYFGSATVFYPAQTDFPNGVPPADFLVVYEMRDASNPDEAFKAVQLDRIGADLAQHPERFRLSVREYSYNGSDPWGFSVIEETSGYQIIELRHRNTQSIDTKYRIESRHVTPLAFKTDGGVGLFMLLIPLYLVCLWLGWVAARRSIRLLDPAIQTLRGRGNGH